MSGRNWTVRGMAGTLVLLCAAGAVRAQNADAKEPAATVNGEVITKGELESLMRKDGPTAMPLPEGQRKQLQMAKLYALIDATLLRQFLKKNAPVIDEKELNGRISDLTVELKNQGKSLTDLCRDLNQSESQLRDNIAATMQWYAYAEKNVTEQDLEKCYQTNKDLFDQVRVRVSEIVFRVPAQVPASERDQIRNRLKELRDKIVANQISFEEAAKQFSQSMTKDQGGDLDWLPHLKGGLLPVPDNVIDTAFTMQPGQISDIMDSEIGFYVIKTTQRDPGHPSEYAKVKSEVRDLYIEEMKMSILAQMRKSAELKIHIQ